MKRFEMVIMAKKKIYRGLMGNITDCTHHNRTGRRSEPSGNLITKCKKCGEEFRDFD